MDKQLQIKKILTAAALFICGAILTAQTPSIIEHIRIPLWAEIDAYPGIELNEKEQKNTSWQNGQYSFAVARIKETADFLVDGMVYGWDFVYVPYDKTRGVEEELEIIPIQKLDETGGRLQYSSPWVQDNKLYCWIDYTRTDFQIQNYNLWASIQHPAIQGRGYGDITDGFDGIQKAAYDALKNAIRNHYRGQIKNKPKEITGSVLIRRQPVLGIDSGRYVINLDFFLESGNIKEYTTF